MRRFYFTSAARPTIKIDLKLTLGGARPDSVLTMRKVRVKVPAGARDVRLFRNGSLVKVWHGDVLKSQSNITFEVQVPVVAGENQFIAYAFNRDNVP